jgi:hypothetical protein
LLLAVVHRLQQALTAREALNATLAATAQFAVAVGPGLQSRGGAARIGVTACRGP